VDNRNVAGAAGAGLGGMFVGMIIGAVIGGVVALLFAPQTGNDTRDMIKNRYGQMRDAFRGGARDTAEMAEKTASQMRQTSSEMR
jgi:gas vesicle protein